MKIFVLGSGTGEPSLQRSSTSMLINYKNKNLLFDIGPGTIKSLLKAKIDYYDIDYVFITHFHPDHILDLPYLLFLYRYKKPKRRKPLYLVGPKGLRNFYESNLKAYGDVIKENYPIKIKELSQNSVNFSSFKIRSFPLMHEKNSIGFRFEAPGQKVIAYTGDTDYCSSLIALAREADMLFIETSFPKKVKGHLTPTLAGLVGRKAKAKSMILIHMYSICEKFDIIDMVKRVYPGKVVKGKDSMRVKL